MSITSEPTVVFSYSGDDSTTDFAITTKYFSTADITVTLRDANDDETTWVLNTDYTLTAAGVSTGGTLTATSAPGTGETLVIEIDPANTQDSSLPRGGAFPSSTVEDELDQATQRDAKLERLFNRCLYVPRTDTRIGSNLQLPIDEDRASKYLKFDANGDPAVASGTSLSAPVQLADDEQIQFGTGTDYWFIYDSTNTQFELNSTDIDGAGTNGVVFSVNDGTDDVTFTGNITVSGGQIVFPATQNASSNVNTLDDYEEGTFAPTLQDSSFSNSESQTYSTQTGRYTKIGRMVYYSLTLTVSSLGSLTTSDPAYIAGLPFATASETNVGGGNVVNASGLNITAGYEITVVPASGGSHLALYLWDGAAAPSQMLISEISDNGGMLINGFYFAAN